MPAGALAAAVFFSRSLSAEGTIVSALAGETHFHGIAVDPRNSDRLYRATHHCLFLVGPDGGVERVSTSQDDFMGFTSSPADSDVLYAGGHPVSGERGTIWRALGKK